MTADEIITAARSAMGIPFRHQGRSARGLDCAGLIVWVANALEIPCIDRADYARNPSGGLLEKMLDTQPCLERVATPQPGDVLLMRFGRQPQHLGISTGNTMIHAYLQAGRVCEHAIDATWRSRIVRVYRFRGVV